MCNGVRIVFVISRGSNGGDDGGGWKGVYYSIDQEVQGQLIFSIAVQERTSSSR